MGRPVPRRPQGSGPAADERATTDGRRPAPGAGRAERFGSTMRLRCCVREPPDVTGGNPLLYGAPWRALLPGGAAVVGGSRLAAGWNHHHHRAGRTDLHETHPDTRCSRSLARCPDRRHEPLRAGAAGGREDADHGARPVGRAGRSTPAASSSSGRRSSDLNVYDTLVAHKSPKELNTFVPVLATEWKVSAGRQGVHVQAPAERQARERQPVHRRGREVQPDAAQEPQGQPGLDDGPAQGGHRRRSDDGEDRPQRVVRRLAAGPVGPERGHHGLEARQGARGQRLGDRGQGRQGRGVAEPELGRQRPVHPQGLAEEQRHHHGAEPELLEGPGQDREDRGARRAVARHPEAPGRER